MTHEDKASLYVSKMPPAITGQGGHGATFAVATALVWGFGLPTHLAMPIMREYNARCSPPWSETELQHKIDSVDASTQQKPRGHLLGGQSPDNGEYVFGGRDNPRPIIHKGGAALQSGPADSKPSRAKKYDVDRPVELPPAIPDPTRRLLQEVFKPGENVCIAPEKMLEDKDRPLPLDAFSAERDWWIAKFSDVDGDPNKVYSTAERMGAFIKINPLDDTGSIKDTNVTDCRIALVEFDTISLQEQWNLIVQSKIPCAAVLYSGGKSLHAWVRVEAKTIEQYRERVKVIYAHFEAAGYPCDQANRNPSRYSRLPGMIRGDNTQDLIALNIGFPSFVEWLAELEMEGTGIEHGPAELADYDPDIDPNTVIGQRWLCKGGSCLWIGPSGIGKSSMAMQAAVTWALGRSLFGITPEACLKSMFLQAENDMGDLAEQFQGVLRGMGLSYAGDTKAMLDKNLVFIRDSIHSGRAFVGTAQRLIERHKPDLVWIDPVLSFIGDDASSQKVCSEFFRNWLNPVSEASGVVWMILHHTGKPSTDPKSRKGWTNAEFAYYGTGSSEMVNWSRAINVLQPVTDTVYRFLLAKRGKRAGVLDMTGKRSCSIYLSHSETGICWEQVAEPEKAKKEPKESKGKAFDPDEFLRQMKGEYRQFRQCLNLICELAECGETTAKKHWRTVAAKLTKDEEFKTYTFNPKKGE